MDGLDKKCRECIIDGMMKIDREGKSRTVLMHVYPKFEVDCPNFVKVGKEMYCNNQSVIKYRMYYRK